MWLWIIPLIKKGYLSRYDEMQHIEQNRSQIQTHELLFSYQSTVRSHYYLQAYQVWSPELSPFIIKAHSTFEPEGNMMPDSFCVQPEKKLAEVSQLLVTRQKLDK